MKKSQGQQRKLITLALGLLALSFLVGVGINSFSKKSDGNLAQNSTEGNLSLANLSTDSLLFKKLEEQNRQYEEQIVFLMALLEEKSISVEESSESTSEISAVPETITHKVAKGETLSSISQRYYGTSKRWNEIYETNKERIPNKNSIKTGLVLIIPE